MKKQFVTVVFDRKKRLENTGEGKVELHIYLRRDQRKYITLKTCNAISWRRYQKSEELKSEIQLYEQVIELMMKKGEEMTLEEMTLENLNRNLGIDDRRREENKRKRLLQSPTGFIDFIKEHMAKEQLATGSIKRKIVTMEAMKRFGRLCRFSDLTPRNVKAFDEFLIGETSRTRVTLYNYHKVVKQYTRLAFQIGLIESDPYANPICKFGRGKSAERKPLTEEELMLLRSLHLPSKEDKVRDLFVFCAYTGLAYVDSQAFDFKTMTEKGEKYTFIDGKRVKTGCSYYTPILPPAMDVLKKYNYQLPKISNQKANDYLHLIESRAGINKPLTMHIARHSFVTLLVANGVQVEKACKMVGHTNIKTTQIYTHIMKSTIEQQVEMLVTKIR